MYNPGLEKAVATATLLKKSYIFHVIHAQHQLHNRTVMRMTDTYRNVPLFLLIITENDALGRISLPLSYSKENLTAKKLSDELCLKFNGKSIHHGTRLEASVADFRLEKSLINDESLKEIFERVESLCSNIS